MIKNSIYGSFSDSLINKRSKSDRADFYGLEADIDLLPTEGINSGSTAYCVDTGSIYIYLEATNTWYPQ